MSANKNQTDYDVIIVGGGLAGLSLSCLLGKIDGLKVACIDRDAPKDQLASDERTTAISYGSAQILSRAGVWDDLQKGGCPIENIEILDGNSPLLLQFLSDEVEGKAFGWIISNHHIRTVLMQHMKNMSVDHIAPARVKDFAVSEGSATVILDDGRELTAKLIVGADGRGSSLREYMDVPVRGWNYNQRAVVCFISHEVPHHNKAVEHFWPAGPFAILPMNDTEDGRHRSSLVFTEHGKKRGGSLMNLTDEEFLAEVQERFPDSYGRVEVINNIRKAYPLSLSHAAEYISPRMVLVADAAHGIHPIAGQGLNLGFRDLGCLATLIEDAVAHDADIGADELLQSYQRKRRPDNMAMVAVTDGLVRLFSNDLPPVKLLRRFGLRAVSKLKPAKKFFMHRAMGE